MKKSLILAVVLVSLACNRNPVSVESKQDFAIYQLKDPSITVAQAQEMDLNDIKLEKEPWMDSYDISAYDYSTHYIYLNKDKETFFKGMMTENNFAFDFLSRPFVIVANGQRVCVGSFVSSLSSMAGRSPVIHDSDIRFYPSDIIPLTWHDIDDYTDARENENLKQGLKEAMVFHAGLTVELLDVNVTENGDNATVSYSFKVTNKDNQALYVPDPDKMGTNLFHYYTNGIDMWLQNEGYYYSQYKPTTTMEEAGVSYKSCYTLLKPGESISRTTQVSYPSLPAGQMKCSFKYAGPKRLTKDERIGAEGKYWIGEITTNELLIEVK